ncbi:MAG: sugar transferase [Candidatus Cohnella colombiensis]|uniref:Sugar transferase n=1 Tax=Candidatus Cohnella colombiensis TaxID=3121368 RepID=A0AA95EZJ9_9BACL|nr:MAG: sugar transferase [Cohnella sp.]
MPLYSKDLELVKPELYAVRNLGSYPLRDLRAYFAVKRAFDFTASLTAIVLYLPFFLVIAILIKLEDPKGPVLFKQVRIGKNGKPFWMYKFRSMISNAEELIEDLLDQNEVKGAMFKMKDDPRVTRLGKFIRKTSIDELPQLWNVLKGDMSLVGPRPSLPKEVAQYSTYDRQRLLVTPGCTGLWQVSGRNGLSFAEMVELDLMYIQRQSIALDIRLILKTIWVMIVPKNAY